MPKRNTRLALFGIAASLALTLGVAAPANAATTTDYCKSVLNQWNQSHTERPSAALQCQMQAGPARQFGYTGPVDGVMGVNSWIGVQRWLASDSRWGFSGAIDGTPDVGTYKAIQRVAAYRSVPSGYYYTGPIDGYPGPNTWKYFAYKIKIWYFSS